MSGVVDQATLEGQRQCAAELQALDESDELSPELKKRLADQMWALQQQDRLASEAREQRSLKAVQSLASAVVPETNP